MKDLRALRSGICSREDREKCRIEMGENLDWACSHCKKARSEDDLDLHPYTLKLLRIRVMKMGGYPFKANDLTVEEWEDLGNIEQCLLIPEE